MRFSDDVWFLTNLGNVCTGFDYGLGAEAKEFDGINRYIRITDINEETSLYDSNNVVSPTFTDNNCIVQENDILFARTGASTGKTYLYNKKDQKLYFAGFLIRANVKREFDSYFIYLQTKTQKYKNWISIMSARSGQPGINAKEYQTYQISYPSYVIQLKISKFMRMIDKRIQAQSKIIEDLGLLKKSISHKIFGDNSLIKKDWKLTKLSDVLIERKTYDVKESKYPHVTLSKDGIYSKSDRYNRDFLVKDEDKNYKITHLNDICYNPANLKFGVICLNSYGDAIFSPIYVTYEVKDGNDAYFISQYVTNSTFIGHIRKYEQGTVYERMAVSSEDFLKGKIYLPSITIQNEISQIFKLLDKKINLELEVLNKLKEQKKYLLSNMFI